MNKNLWGLCKPVIRELVHETIKHGRGGLVVNPILTISLVEERHDKLMVNDSILKHY